MNNKHVPFLDLNQQFKTIKPQIEHAIQRVFARHHYILGEEVEQFENEYAKYLNAKHVVTVGSGTDGLILALWALSIGKDDEVILPATAYIAAAIAINRVGAKPVLVDSDSETYQIDIKQVEKYMTKRTKAIMPVHLYGAPTEMDSILKLAKKHKLYVVEDASQAHGSMFGGKKLGTLGDIGVFSFYPTKNLGAYGDGGALATNNKTIYNTLTRLRNYGQSRKNYSDIIGVNSRLDEIQAAILRVKLKYLDTWNKKRNTLAKEYKKQLDQSVKMQRIVDNGISNYHLFVIETNQRDKLQDFLKKKGVGTLVHYPVPIPLQKSFKYLGHKRGDFPNAERLAKKILSLPMFPELTKSEIRFVCKAIKEFYR